MIRINMPPDGNRHISGKSVYCLYIMLKNHFQGKYDVVKYNWRMRISDSAFNKRKDKYFFERLSEKYKLKELIYIFISNLVSNQDAWIGEISDADAIDFYRKYLIKLRSINDTFVEDIKNIYYFSKKSNKTLKEIIDYNSSTGTSYLFRLLQSQIITSETFIILDSFLDIINKYDTDMDNIIWNNYSIKFNAYKKILKIDKETAKTLFKTTVNNCKGN